MRVDHPIYMHRCLELAAKARGMVGINPMVGAVLVRKGEIIAEGYYRGQGTDHAEVDMLRDLVKTDRWSVSPEDTLYVNLEPCCHHGATPPCTDAIIAAGIAHVVIGMQDPDKRVAGQGIAALRKAGISVDGPVERAQCERLNRGYISLRTKGRPYITLKRAQTMDGRVANNDGSKLCITSKEQNIWSHTHLRTTHDAILVGVNTVITDNPELTIRLSPQLPAPSYQPLCIILDPHLRIPVDAKVVREGSVVITNEEIKKSRNQEIKILEEKGVTILSVPIINNHFNWDALWSNLQSTIYNLQSILVEGGPATWSAFKDAGMMDEEVVLIGN